MAIAYFIPDQNKLLTGQRFSNGSSNSNTRSARSTAGSSRLPQTNPGNETAANNNNASRGYGTTINITVPTLNNTPQDNMGCWDFLTQVFCQALRFYHESSQVQPTVIQISVNFNTQTSTTATTNEADTTATTTNNQTTATATSTTATTDERTPGKLPKQKY